MGWLEGLVSGIGDRQREIDLEKFQKWDQANQREASLFTTILQHSTDPKLRSMAATGLITASQGPKRRSGFLGYLGDLEANPLTGRIQQYLKTPQPYEEDVITRGLPSKQALPTVPPQTGAAALPATQTTTPGAPAPTPTQPMPGAPTPPPGMQQAAPPPVAPGPPGPPQTNVAGVYTQPGLASANAVYGPTDTGGFATPPPGLPTMGAAQNVAAPVGVERRTGTRLPQIFPTAGDQAIAARRSQIQGDFRALRDIYLEQGLSPLEATQQAAKDVVAINSPRSTLSLREGERRMLPDGSWVQDLYDPLTGEVVRSIPATAPSALATGSPTMTDRIAFRRFGRPGEDPRTTQRRITPQQMGYVLEDERIEAGLRAAEVKLAQAKVAADAPLARTARNEMIELLNTKWGKLQESGREGLRQFTIMQTGLRRFREGDRIGGAEAVRVTFEKILDEISVVREGEYERQSKGLSLLERFQGFIQGEIQGGGRIPEEALGEMVETARQFLEALQGGWKDVEQQRISQQATANDIDPALVFGGPPRAVPGAGGAGGAGGGAGGVSLDSPIRVGPDGKFIVGQ